MVCERSETAAMLHRCERKRRLAKVLVKIRFSSIPASLGGRGERWRGKGRGRERETARERRRRREMKIERERREKEIGRERESLVDTIEC